MQVDCPTCKRSVEWVPESEFRPFCSKKCQLIDLGDWATEAHAIASDSSHDANVELDEEAIAAQYEQQAQDFFKAQ